VTARVDVAIAGAGPAGVATALVCARHGLEVGLLDRARFPRDKACGEGLLPSAIEALAALGLAARVRPHGLVLDGIGFAVPGGPEAEARFCDRAGEPARGLGIQRVVLDAELVRAAHTTPGVTVLEGVEVKAPLIERGAVVGLSTSAGAIRARAVVAADGLRSPLRRQLGLELPPAHAGRLGLRVHLHVRGGLPFGRRVRVLVGPALEYYITPVSLDTIQVAVLGGQRAFAQAGVSPATLVEHLLGHPELKPRLQGAEPTDKPLGAGPFRQRARSVVTEGALLCGDAAGYLDAITGEGVGLALRTGMAAGEAVAAALRCGPLGSVRTRALHGYVRDHAAITRDSERLTRLVLLLARAPWLTRRAVSALASSPALFTHLLRVQAGAPLSSVPMLSWAHLMTG
jgi:flavin-dependent dehydrogenase